VLANQILKDKNLSEMHLKINQQLSSWNVCLPFTLNMRCNLCQQYRKLRVAAKRKLQKRNLSGLKCSAVCSAKNPKTAK